MLEYIKGFICWFVFFSLATIFAGRVEIQIVDGDALQQYAAMRLKDAFIQQSTFLDMQVRFTLDDTMPPEAYRNEVSDDKNGSTVHIQGGDSRGILYGTILYRLKVVKNRHVFLFVP